MDLGKCAHVSAVLSWAAQLGSRSCLEHFFPTPWPLGSCYSQWSEERENGLKDNLSLMMQRCSPVTDHNSGAGGQ